MIHQSKNLDPNYHKHINKQFHKYYIKYVSTISRACIFFLKDDEFLNF